MIIYLCMCTQVPSASLGASADASPSHSKHHRHHIQVFGRGQRVIRNPAGRISAGRQAIARAEVDISSTWDPEIVMTKAIKSPFMNFEWMMFLNK
jgi:hypothetical protein